MRFLFKVAREGRTVSGSAQPVEVAKDEE